ncbi:MAG: 2-hydroxychromene-2-carboxylate isomerase [Alphaproteobacteria bacterium]
MAQLECFFDCSSPWTYLGFHNIQPLAAEFGIEIDWRPILVGGVFNTINPSVYASREQPVAAKVAYQGKDLADWARLAGLQIRHRPTIFPINSVKAMRACLVAQEQDKLVPLATLCFEAYWGDDRDIADDQVMRELIAAADLNADRVMQRIADPAIKDRLKANTQELIDRGGYGSPTFFVDRDDMYFGNDRLPLIRDALERVKAG